MRGAELSRFRRRTRLVLLWVFTAVLAAVYLALPDSDDAAPEEPPRSGSAAQDVERIDIEDVSPSGALAGSAVTIHYVGALPGREIRAFAGKTELRILARHPNTVVARLPPELPPGRVKIRVSDGPERSKPFDVRVKPTNLRAPFRKLVGGIALLALGISMLARGVRQASGLGGARTLARLARRQTASLLIGALAGASTQSTTAAAGFISGLVRSHLLALGPAAIAFLGAGLGAATAPLVTGLIDSREGLMIVAAGVLWLGLSPDRRGAAGRLLLGAGLIVFGLQTLRPGIEPLVQDPTVLSVLGDLRVTNPLRLALAALLGAALVAVFQGPAAVLVLVLAVAQTTTRWDLQTALAILSGSGFGSAVAALLTAPPGPRGRALAKLYLILGGLVTLVSAVTGNLFAALSDRLLPSLPHEVDWGSRVLLPNMALHLGVAFALSQLAAVALVVPFVPFFARFVEKGNASAGSSLSHVGDATAVVSVRLSQVIRDAGSALEPLLALVLEGRRESSRIVEHRLADARADLEDLISGAVSVLERSGEGDVIRRAAFSCLQLQRALESLARQGDRLLDERIAEASGPEGTLALGSDFDKVLRDLDGLLRDDLASLAGTLESRAPIDLDTARAREIQMNGIEARTRTLVQSATTAAATRAALAVLEMANAYEACGNQAYRLAEVVAELYPEANALSNFDASVG